MCRPIVFVALVAAFFSSAMGGDPTGGIGTKAPSARVARTSAASPSPAAAVTVPLKPRRENRTAQFLLIPTKWDARIVLIPTEWDVRVDLVTRSPRTSPTHPR
jgi:hypothetical protein